jgi:hypothetical protein
VIRGIRFQGRRVGSLKRGVRSARLLGTAVLDLTNDLKGAAAMTDPKDTDTKQTPVDGELAVDDLDAVTGGAINEQNGEGLVGFFG